MLNVTQHANLGDGWQYAELLVETGPWPGHASVIVSPDGDVAIMGDANTESWPYDVDAESPNVDVEWARRVIRQGTGTWPTRTLKATPRPGTVVNVDGEPCNGAYPESYPLYADCGDCGRKIRCADGTAGWVHTSDYRPACSAQVAS